MKGKKIKVDKDKDKASDLGDLIFNTLSSIECSVKKNPELKKVLVQAMADLPLLIEYMPTWARMQRVRYLALKEEGFTEAQAIEICKGY